MDAAENNRFGVEHNVHTVSVIILKVSTVTFSVKTETSSSIILFNISKTTCKQ